MEDTVIQQPPAITVAPASYMPVMAVVEAIQRITTIKEFVSSVMVEGTDYGKIPGTDKKTLLKPGAEKLSTLFGFTPRFVAVSTVEDWTGEAHGGEPLFSYRYCCKLYRGKAFIAEGIGSCSSWEKKYRFRDSKRVCPSCGKDAIIKGREEFGGGWLCFGKKGGCGTKFLDSDPAIVGQAVGQTANPDIADLVNTIDKMAQKRALIAATLIAVNASEFFTQDLEDFTDSIEADFKVVKKGAPENGKKESPWTYNDLFKAANLKGQDVFDKVKTAYQASDKSPAAIAKIRAEYSL